MASFFVANYELLSVAEIEKLFGSDFQYLAHFEDYIKGHSHVSQLNGAYVTAVNINKLCQLQLGEFFHLTVIYNIESEFFI